MNVLSLIKIIIISWFNHHILPKGDQKIDVTVRESHGDLLAFQGFHTTNHQQSTKCAKVNIIPLEDNIDL